MSKNDATDSIISSLPFTSGAVSQLEALLSCSLTSQCRTFSAEKNIAGKNNLLQEEFKMVGFEVKAIRAHRLRGGKTDYLVEWEDVKFANK